MSQSQRIPVSQSRRLERIRTDLAPILFFAVCVLLSLWLWKRHGRSPNALGEVEVVRVDVIAPFAGVLAASPQGRLELFDDVDEGSVVARLDSTRAEARLETLRLDRERLEHQLVASEARIIFDRTGFVQEQQREAVRLSWQIESLRLDVLDRMTRIAVDGVEIQKLDLELESNGILISTNTVPRLDYDRLRFDRDRIKTRIGEATVALEEAEAQRDLAVERYKNLVDPIPAEVEELLRPLRATVAVQESRMRELQLEIDQLAIRAPISGTIVEILRRPGQTVQAGEAMMTVARADGRHIVSYIRQSQHLPLREGMSVAVTARSSGRRFGGVLNDVGPQFEPVPPHHLADPTRPEWGLPVRLAIPATEALRPGELVDLILRESPRS